jgi:hypothetical protein
VSSRVRLTKSPERYAAVRDRRREFVYEALLATGRTTWSAGDRVRVYRRVDGEGGIVAEGDDGQRDPLAQDPRDYDAEHYIRVLRETFAERLSRAVTPDAFAAIVADPAQPSLFDQCLKESRPILVQRPAAAFSQEIGSSGGQLPELRNRS